MKFKPLVTFLPLEHQGKTRDIHPARSPNHMLVVATDRLSTHNVVHRSEISNKGEVLTALTIYWLTRICDRYGINNHLVAYGKRMYDYLPSSQGDYSENLHHRAIVVKRLKMAPVEFIFRAYLAGSLYDTYYSKGLPNPYEIELPDGLQLMHQFPSPIFTPTDKSETDDPLPAEATKQKYPREYQLALETFAHTRRELNRGDLELIDSKFEIGLNEEGEPCLADEITTPDSSRYADFDEIVVGKKPPWKDKQIARDEAERVWASGSKAPLVFSPEIRQKLSGTYLEIFERITGESLHEFQHNYLG